MTASGDGFWKVAWYSDRKPDENGVVGCVFPDYDDHPHDLMSPACACAPVLDGKGLLIHNAFDGRGKHTSEEGS